MIETQELEAVVASQLQALRHVLKEVKDTPENSWCFKRCLGRGESRRIGRSTTGASCKLPDAVLVAASTNKGRLSSRPLSQFWSGLQSPYVLRLPALGAFDDIKLNLLTFLQTAEAI